MRKPRRSGAFFERAKALERNRRDRVRERLRVRPELRLVRVHHRRLVGPHRRGVPHDAIGFELHAVALELDGIVVKRGLRGGRRVACGRVFAQLREVVFHREPVGLDLRVRTEGPPGPCTPPWNGPAPKPSAKAMEEASQRMPHAARRAFEFMQLLLGLWSCRAG